MLNGKCLVRDGGVGTRGGRRKEGEVEIERERDGGREGISLINTFHYPLAATE